VALADDLIKVAVQLCPTKPGRPSYAVVRRCISTAYYAVFHALGEEVARPHRRLVQLAARRLLDHGQAHDVADTLRRHLHVLWLPGRPSCDPDLVRFAADFIDLHLARHRADYDATFAPTKAEATRAIQQAEAAILALGAARANSPDQLQAVCAAMVANPATRKRMVMTA
jgi:hypothetical protein